MKKLMLIILSVLLLTSCSKPIARVGGIKISEGEFNFYLKSVKDAMKGTEFETDEDWQNKEIEGRKAIEVAKEQAMDNAINNALYIETAKAAGVGLTADDLDDIDAVKKQFIKGLGSDKDYKKFLKDNDISDDFIELMCESTVYYSKIADIVLSETTITDEMKQAHFVENMGVFERNVRNTKHILIPTIDPVTMQPKSPEEAEEASVLAKEIFDRVQSGENFDRLMHEYSEDPGLKDNPDGYIFRDNEMVKEYEEATDSIGINQITLCKTEYGYHIIKKLPITWEIAEEEVTNDIIRELVEAQVEKWQKEYSIEVTRDEEIYASIK